MDQTARVWDAATGQPLTPPLQHPWSVRQVRFDNDGHRLLTSRANGTVWAWDLPCSTCRTTEMLGLAQVLCGCRIDEHGGIMPLKPSELKAMWATLRETRGDLFHFTAEDLAAWRLQAAEECLRGRHWSAALWYLDRLLKNDPDNWLHHARRGLALAELERWADASADFAEVVKRAPAEMEAWCLYAVLRLQAGDAAGYRRACAALLQEQEKSKDPRTAYLTAWTCVLSEESGVKAARLVELAKRAVAHEPRDPDYLGTLGAALFRAGEMEEASRRLHDALSLRGRRPSVREWLWLALVRKRMGSSNEAQQWLAKATVALAAPASSHDSAETTAMPWVQRLQLSLLQHEVERQLKSDKPSGK